ncbi:MAG TPA: FAD:protein FMN transferase, partial [Paucimonas sp.]|nr:FAD:protein FMN transferase [Paucimonas sp.]
IPAGVLRRAWNFRDPRVPGREELAPILALIGWPEVERNGLHVRLPRAGMEIDFGGFGKEYAADRAAAMLVERGARHGYVNLGGDLRVFGPQPDGSPWVIGIQDPRASDRLVASIPVQSGALTTSGDYERYFDADGKRYCHILDPHTGMPVEHWRSVSVLAPLAIAAGSCATIAMLKAEQALPFLEGANVAYLAVDCRGEVFSKAL